MEKTQAFILVRGYDNEAEFIGVFTDENDIIHTVIKYCFDGGHEESIFPGEDDDFYISVGTLEKFTEKIWEYYNDEDEFWKYLKKEEFFVEKVPLYTKNQIK